MDNGKMTLAKHFAIAMSFLCGVATCQASESTWDIPPEDRILLEAYFQSREQLYSQEEARLHAQQVPDIWLERQEGNTSINHALPSETPCFQITELRIDLPQGLSPAQQRLGASRLSDDPFYFLRQALDVYRDQCIGREGLHLISRRMSAIIYSQGYSTTRLDIPEQQLSSGTLTLTLIPGVIRSISFSASDISGDWKAAFPIRPGELLNINDLQQGMDQVRRVYMQNVEMQIVPSDNPGESDILIDVKQAAPQSLSVTPDENDRKEAQRTQAAVDFAIEHPLGWSDLYVIGLKNDAGHKDEHHGHGGGHLFDGELSLSPESEFFARQEIDTSMGSGSQSFYAGVDLGRFNNPPVQYLLGEKLAGAAFGLRGRVNGMRYDLFLAWALYKEQNFRTNSQGVGFNLLYRY